jgi:hypothetical protein
VCVCVCMCVCMYVCMYLRMYVCLHTHELHNTDINHTPIVQNLEINLESYS